MSGAKAPCRRCGHDRYTHLPFAPGHDRPGYCGIVTGTRSCPCWQFIPERPFAWLLRWLHEWSRPRYDFNLPDAPPERPVPCPPPGPTGWYGETELDMKPQRPRPYAPHPPGAHRGEPQ